MIARSRLVLLLVVVCVAACAPGAPAEPIGADLSDVATPTDAGVDTAALDTMVATEDVEPAILSGPPGDFDSAPSASVRKGFLPSPKLKLVKVKHVSTVAEISAKPPAALGYRIYNFDVGTGLSILVQGAKFNLLFDGGSGDDLGLLGSSGGNRNRLLAYLFATLGPSGPPECAPLGDGWTGYAGDKKVKLQHLFLSHAHLDHGSQLADVIHCYDVVNIWDTGAINDTDFYLGFLQAVAAEPGMTYHTVAGPTADRTISVFGQVVTIPAKTKWVKFGEGTQVVLDGAATLAVLFANGDRHPDMNQNSLVVRLDLGAISLLLVGDTESGARKDPSSPAAGAEAILIKRHPSELDADILQVGHHGSLSSNRLSFLQAVSPLWALIGVGPKQYSGVTLPDKAVLDALASVKATVYRTDVNDAKCPAPDRVGVDDGSPGGCDAYVLDIAPFKPKPPSGMTEAEFYASCSGRCGDVSTKGCKCDAGCRARADCCSDACSVCVTMPQCSLQPSAKFAVILKACSDHCEDGLPFGDCGCGPDCVDAGDCCLDLCASCPAQTVCAPGLDDDPFN